jgi:hypothetical protein
MSRENAIEFLNDIRVGIDYLENMYSLKESDSKINVRRDEILFFTACCKKNYLCLLDISNLSVYTSRKDDIAVDD